MSEIQCVYIKASKYVPFIDQQLESDSEGFMLIDYNYDPDNPPVTRLPKYLKTQDDCIEHLLAVGRAFLDGQQNLASAVSGVLDDHYQFGEFYNVPDELPADAKFSVRVVSAEEMTA